MMTLLAQNWSALVLVLVGLAYWLLRYVAVGKAKQVALKYLAVAHKIAVNGANLEILALSKTAYSALPPVVKPFVPATLFSAFVIEAYQEVVQLIGEAQKKAAEETPKKEKLETLLAKITPGNVHNEVGAGEPKAESAQAQPQAQQQPEQAPQK